MAVFQELGGDGDEEAGDTDAVIPPEGRRLRELVATILGDE